MFLLEILCMHGFKSYIWEYKSLQINDGVKLEALNIEAMEKMAS